MIVAALLLQAAPAAAPVTRASAAPPASFSILLGDCAEAAAGGPDVVVCGANPAKAQRLPLPDEAEPTPGYVKPDSGDYRDNRGGGGSCAARMGGCQVGFGPPIMPIIAAGVKGIGDALANRREARSRGRDGDRRRPIDLSDAPVGHLEP